MALKRYPRRQQPVYIRKNQPVSTPHKKYFDINIVKVKKSPEGLAQGLNNKGEWQLLADFILQLNRHELQSTLHLRRPDQLPFYLAPSRRATSV